MSDFIERAGSGLFPVATVSCALITIAGCGGGQYDVVPVAGRVLLNGEPVVSVAVNFIPTEIVEGTIETGPPSVGTTDDEGRFSLIVARSDRSPGAVPGEHRVTFQNLFEGDADGNSSPIGTVLPKKYQREALTITVPPEGDRDMLFELDGE